jgi:hypothetical protein
MVDCFDGEMFADAALFSGFADHQYFHPIQTNIHHQQWYTPFLPD